MSKDFETIVVGGGAMGTAAAYHLAREGHSVLLLEQFAIGHDKGSSHGESRIIRLSYDHPHYIKLAKRSYEMWADLEEDADEELLTITGGLDLSLPGNAAYEACISSMEQEAVEFETLDELEISRRFPQFHLRQGTVGTYQPDAGILNPTQCVQVLAKMAELHGAGVVDKSPVRSIEFDDRGAIVRTVKKQYHCRKLIVTVGPWAKEVLKPLGLDLPLTVSQEQYVFFKPKNLRDFQPGKFPIFAHYGTNRNGEDIEHYGFPVFGLKGVKMAEHHAGALTTATERSFELDPAGVERLKERARKLLPDAAGDIIHGGTCLYTNTPDRHFIIDLVPGHPHIAIAAGFSGHGFKFAILVGQILADLVNKGHSSTPIDLFALGRLRELIR